MIKPTAIHRWFAVTGEAPMATTGQNPSTFIPDRVHLTQNTGEPLHMTITGPIRHAKTGRLSARRGRADWGRYGGLLNRAPQWVQDLATKHEDTTDWTC